MLKNYTPWQIAMTPKAYFHHSEQFMAQKTNDAAPVKCADGSKLLTDMKDIAECWKDHFQNPLHQRETADEDVAFNLEVCSIKEVLCSPITMDELELHLKEARRSKSPGQDGILNFLRGYSLNANVALELEDLQQI